MIRVRRSGQMSVATLGLQDLDCAGSRQVVCQDSKRGLAAEKIFAEREQRTALRESVMVAKPRLDGIRNTWGPSTARDAVAADVARGDGVAQCP